MTADFSSLIAHPKYHEIVDKLMHGSEPREVANWLKLAYSEKEQNHLRLSMKLLQDFVRSGLLDYKNQFALDISKAKDGDFAHLNKKVAASLLNNKTYQERLQECADKKIDLEETLMGTALMLRVRLEQVFDKIQEDPSCLNSKNEYIFINLADKVAIVAEKCDRLINKSPDLIIQHNINNQQMVDQKLAFFQEALRETLSEMDSEASLLFMEKWTEKLQKLQPPAEASYLSDDQKLKEAKLLQGSVEDLVIEAVLEKERKK